MDDRAVSAGATDVAGLVVPVVRHCVEALGVHTDRDWRAVTAHELEWSVWDTVVHLGDVLYFYAAQALLAEDDYICFELAADAHATPARLVSALGVNGRMLAAAVGVADPHSVAFHNFGPSDPVGFAAMGVVETLVHTYDALRGLDPGTDWRPPAAAAAAVLARLFPDAPPGDDPAAVLLHVCGRIPLGARPRPTAWRWQAGPVAPGDAQTSNETPWASGSSVE